MKEIRIILAIILTINMLLFDPGPPHVFATEDASAETSEQAEITEEILPDASTEELHFYAVNAGYKDDDSVQNYDFFALEKSSDELVNLGDYRIVYLNSSGNQAGEISFNEEQKLDANLLVFGFGKSPQYENNLVEYLYNFGTAGLASTGGELDLYKDEQLVDAICWGKLECANQISKFSANEDANLSAVLQNGEFVQIKYYPEINEAAIMHIEKQKDYCDSLRITEVYSFFETDSSEQFVEIYNPGQTCSLEGLNIVYKSKKYALHDIISANSYLAFRDEKLILTKNPTTSNSISIESDDERILDEMQYPHGQKVGLSYMLANLEGEENWVQSYHPTPGEANIYQEFQSCPEGKVINESTGNCVNEETVSETICPEGKYLNPETGRCKKIEEEAALTECADGYERNPETNRCRKIQDADGSEYAPKTSVETSFSEPKRFVAYVALALSILAGLAYVMFQYRDEISRIFRAIFGKTKRLFLKLGSKRRDFDHSAI